MRGPGIPGRPADRPDRARAAHFLPVAVLLTLALCPAANCQIFGIMAKGPAISGEFSEANPPPDTTVMSIDSVLWTLNGSPFPVMERTPGWRVASATPDTYAFIARPYWPLTARVFYSARPRISHQYFINPVGHYVWYTLPLGAAQPRVMFVDSLGPVGLDAHAAAGPGFGLGAAPGLFRSATSLEFTLDRDCPVVLAVFDGAGRRVRVLAGQRLAAGRHRFGWDGTDAGGRAVRAGVYLARLDAAGRSSTARLVKAE